MSNFLFAVEIPQNAFDANSEWATFINAVNSKTKTNKASKALPSNNDIGTEPNSFRS